MSFFYRGKFLAKTERLYTKDFSLTNTLNLPFNPNALSLKSGCKGRKILLNNKTIIQNILPKNENKK